MWTVVPDTPIGVSRSYTMNVTLSNVDISICIHVLISICLCAYMYLSTYARASICVGTLLDCGPWEHRPDNTGRCDHIKCPLCSVHSPQ